MTTLRNAIASTIVAAALVTGSTGVAGAAVTPDRPPAEVVCRMLERKLDALERRAQQRERQEVRLLEMRARAEEAGRTRLVARIDAMLAELDVRQARLAERIAAVQARYDENCAPAT